MRIKPDWMYAVHDKGMTLFTIMLWHDPNCYDDVTCMNCEHDYDMVVSEASVN